MWVQERTRWNSLEKHDFEERQRKEVRKQRKTEERKWNESVCECWVCGEEVKIDRHAVGKSEGYKGRERLMWAIGWRYKWTDEIESYIWARVELVVNLAGCLLCVMPLLLSSRIRRKYRESWWPDAEIREWWETVVKYGIFILGFKFWIHELSVTSSLFRLVTFKQFDSDQKIGQKGWESFFFFLLFGFCLVSNGL